MTAPAARERDDLARRLAAAHADRGRIAVTCAAAARLVGCVGWEETAAGILDVLVNLVGCEDAAIYATPPDGGPPRRVVAVGPEAAAHATPATVGRALRIPFELDGRCLGALVLFRLVPHKAGIEPHDRDILALIARHAAAVLGGGRRPRRVAEREGP